MVRCEKCILRDTGLSTRVCIKCGIEKYVLSDCSYANCGFTMRHSPFLCGYSRTKRFRGMVEALFWPTPANPDTKMLQYLLLRKFGSREEILQCMSTAPLKDKRFVSLHIFCRLLNPNYKEPSHGCLFRMLKRLVSQFQHIESRFKLCFPKEPFINYMFLIRHLLTKLEFHSYLPYVKQLKCEKRKTRYNSMLATLDKCIAIKVHV